MLYHQCMQEAGLNLTHLRDKVHLMRQLIRLFDEAIRDVTLDVPKPGSSNFNSNAACCANTCNRCWPWCSRLSSQATKA